MIILQKNVKEKRENSGEDINSIRPYLQLLIQRTKELQTEVFEIIHYFIISLHMNILLLYYVLLMYYFSYFVYRSNKIFQKNIKTELSI